MHLASYPSHYAAIARLPHGTRVDVLGVRAANRKETRLGRGRQKLFQNSRRKTYSVNRLIFSSGGGDTMASKKFGEPKLVQGFQSRLIAKPRTAIVRFSTGGIELQRCINR